MSQSDVGMGYDYLDAGGRAMQKRLPSDSVTQQVQEQSSKYRGDAEIPGYSTLTRPPGIVDGWENVPLSSVIRLMGGVTYSKNDSSDEQKNGFLPVLRANNIQKGRLIFEDLVYVPNSRISKQQKIKQGDIVIAMSSGSRSVVGKAARAANDWLGGFGAFCGVLRPSELIEERYVNWFTASSEYRNKVSELAAGVNINNLKPSHFDEIFIPFAPLAEQQQIAAKLDELVAQVDTLKTRLGTIPKILKRFRQSVLASAVSGKLTEDWSGNNPDTTFLANEAELTGFRGKELAILPKNWQWLKFDQVASVASNLHDPLLTPISHRAQSH
jgi:Type I restriction modification DNA specificity domain